MKFHHLPLGAFFDYQGSRYRKSAPLMATEDTSGRQRMIPRSARVFPLQSTGAAVKPDTRMVAMETVESALGTYHATCLQTLNGQEEGADRERTRAQLEKARARFLQMLKE